MPNNKRNSKSKKPNKKSVCPLGLTLPRAKSRLDAIESEEDKKRDPEHIMMSLWERENTRDTSKNFGKVPVDNILHVCTEKCGASRGFYGGMDPHEYTELNEHDLKVINATVQWLSTNCGRSFLHKFEQELNKTFED